MGPDHDGKEARPPVTPEYLATVREIVGLGACVRSDDTGSSVTLFANWSGGDDGLALLEKLADVQQIIVKAPLTNTAIPQLKKLSQLKHLELQSGKISAAGPAELKGSLPNANVVGADER